MYNITIIFSMHIQIGECNSNNLYNIIVQENPEIIFEEFDILRTEDEYYRNGHYKNQKGSSLETIAIMNYLENFNVEYVPVDTYDVKYFPTEMYKEISIANPDYDKVFSENIIKAGQKGFQYLNSIDCYNLLEELHLIEENAIKNSKNNKLITDYNSWKSVSNARDTEMLNNIYEYSKMHKYNNAVFIIGAEHKKSIMKKIDDYNKMDNIKIKWWSWRIA
jgi:hypothetical protein